MPKTRRSKKERMRSYLAVSLTRKVSKFKYLSSTEPIPSVRLPRIQAGTNLVSIDPRDTMATMNGRLVRTSGAMPSETKVRNWRYRYLNNFTPGVNGSDLSHDKTNDKSVQKGKLNWQSENHVVLPSIKVKPATPMTVTLGGSQSRSPASGGLFPQISRTSQMRDGHKQHSLKVS